MVYQWDKIKRTGGLSRITGLFSEKQGEKLEVEGKRLLQRHLYVTNPHVRESFYECILGVRFYFVFKLFRYSSGDKTGICPYI